MSEFDDPEDKTEEATEHHLEKIREQGQVLRSRELNLFIILFFVLTILLMYWISWVQSTMHLFSDFLHFDKNFIKNGFFSGFLAHTLYHTLGQYMWTLAGLFVGSTALLILATAGLGGLRFSPDFYVPKLERCNPFSGLARMFSFKSLIELCKSFLKIFIVFIGFLCVFFLYRKETLALPWVDYHKAIPKVLHDAIFAFWFMSLFIALVVIFDVVVQWREHLSKTKMSKKEVMDEYKEMEGKPEVKSKLKQLQRKMSERRMMTKVPAADVILVNPTHYAVALAYDKSQMEAPIVLAKGADEIAKRICDIAKEANVPFVSAPPLTRSLYYTTDLNKPIPAGLYIAVAQVLAYVYQLKLYRKGKGAKPKNVSDLPIPDELQH